MMNNELETAASYLIILQNLERPIISRQVQSDKLNAIAGIISSEALDLNSQDLGKTFSSG